VLECPHTITRQAGVRRFDGRRSILSDHDIIRLARDGVEAFGDGDWARTRAALARDTVSSEPGTGRRTTGREQSVHAVQAWRAAVPDAIGTITNEFASRTTAVLEVVWERTCPAARRRRCC
jgi:hypothetical protein